MTWPSQKLYWINMSLSKIVLNQHVPLKNCIEIDMSISKIVLKSTCLSQKLYWNRHVSLKNCIEINMSLSKIVLKSTCLSQKSYWNQHVSLKNCIEIDSTVLKKLQKISVRHFSDFILYRHELLLDIGYWGALPDTHLVAVFSKVWTFVIWVAWDNLFCIISFLLPSLFCSCGVWVSPSVSISPTVVSPLGAGLYRLFPGVHSSRWDICYPLSTCHFLFHPAPLN